jgi:hypothetical protein
MMRGSGASSTIIQSHKGMVTLYWQDDVTYKERAERRWKRQKAPAVLFGEVGLKLDRFRIGICQARSSLIMG